MHRSLFSIHAKLLLVILVLLLIPWMGYQYVREMKSFLLHGQEDALLLTARAVSTVLNDRTELFNPDTGVPKLLGDPQDLYAHSLNDLLVLDGQFSDWGDLSKQLHTYTGDTPLICDADYDPDSFTIEHLLGYRANFLYALFKIKDDKLVYRDRKLRRLDHSDHLRVTIQDPIGDLRRYLLTARQPGRMSIYLMDKEWRYPLTGDPVYEIAGVLKNTDDGYNIELRIPRYMIGADSRVAFSLADVDDSKKRIVRKVISTPSSNKSTGLSRVFINSPEIEKILYGLDRPIARIWILDVQQRVRSVVGSLSQSTENSNSMVEKNNFVTKGLAQIEKLYDFILGSPAEEFKDISTDVSHRPDEIFKQVLTGVPHVQRRLSLDRQAEILMAAHPIWSGDEVLGAVVVEQSSNEVLALHHQTLRNVTTTTLIIFLVVTLALVTFASRLTLRIGRLRNATDRAITPEGRVREERINDESEARDEIGDLSRSVSGMLGRLSQYTRYLEAMPDTLAHELSNPLNVVNSSLDNLQKELPSTEQSKYMDRAKKGIIRLGSIITNLTEAANLEDAMRGETWEKFNLVELVSSYVEGYQLSHPEHRFDLEIKNNPLIINGTPDHIAQMLDKLADNAVDFGVPGKPIVMKLERANGDARLSVLNEGPGLPVAMGDRLFDPMISVGKTHAKQSHLGLGLYVVRLIVEYHQGNIEASNRGDVSGAKFIINLPLTQMSGPVTSTLN